jgi:outer membrane immunogenic protein
MRMLKIAALAATSMFAISPVTHAADYGNLTTPMPTFTWTGPYIGLQGGYVNQGLDGQISVGSVLLGRSSAHGSGFVAGPYAGYNIQFDRFVVGTEADWSYADFKDSSKGVNWSSSWTARLRGGYLITERTLVYATAGIGLQNATIIGTPTFHNTYGGEVVGGGIEYAFTPQIHGKIEGLYENLGKVNNQIPQPPLPPVEIKTAPRNDFVFRTGISYNF